MAFPAATATAAAASPSFPFRLTSPKPQPQKLTFSSLLANSPGTRLTYARSLDVSKDDSPTQQQEQPPPPQQLREEDSGTEASAAPDFDKRRLEEKFAVLNTGIYECRSCGYKYDESLGDPSYPIAPGLQFDKIPDDWRCPTCGAAKSFFESKSVEIAGFAQNQQFGFGTNTLTSGQKAVLIYGSLLLFFILFLSGYFLQ
ncbi:hypothetical protein MLD38_038666 [Melastoma candidum]|nr:hypothetical protein MLD38_038666 [Melastoma candidum]